MKSIILLSSVALTALTAFGAPVIQVRDDSKAPTISVIAWDAGNAEFGLRTRLRRDGSHLGEGRVGDHRLYLSSSFVESSGGFVHAVAHTGKLLKTTATLRDVDACRFGPCTPIMAAGLAVSDEFLREHRDSLVVTLRPKTGRTWSIRLDGAVIGAYLTAIDSVSATLKK